VILPLAIGVSCQKDCPDQCKKIARAGRSERGQNLSGVKGKWLARTL
jgi:hypothetical protein